MEHREFHYTAMDDVRAELRALGKSLPLSDNTAVLNTPLTVGDVTLPNRLAIQPMEGCDGTADGAPDELTRRRYRRFAASGAALVWAEATAVVPEGRANPRQLMLTADNVDVYKAMVEEMREISRRENGFSPFIVLQMTHSGRYSKPTGTPAPLIAYNNPIFEKNAPIDPVRVVSDDYLASLPAHYAETARLAALAGFDAVDIKCCHRYLMSELLSAYEREGRYGGDFAGRTRLLRETVEAVKTAAPSSLTLTARLNLYDGFPYPYGFGVTDGGGLVPTLDEAKAVVSLLHEKYGMPLLDFTIGNPYVNPHVNRPYDKGGYLPPEHPLEGVARMMECVGEVRRAFPELAVIGSGYSYLRQFAPELAAGAVESGVCDMAGFGREAFAYPTFARDILQNGAIDPKKCCITCGKCTELMRAGSVAGCVPRDSAIYAPIYQRDVLKK